MCIHIHGGELHSALIAASRAPCGKIDEPITLVAGPSNRVRIGLKVIVRLTPASIFSGENNESRPRCH